MPRKQELNEYMRAETLGKITRSALSIFTEYGYHGATIKQIADATDLSYGLVYHYFPSKEMIFRYLVDFAIDSAIKAISDALDVPGTAWGKIERLSATLVRNAFSGESSQYFLIISQAMTEGKSIPGLPDYIEKRSSICYEKIIPIIIEAQKSGEAANGDPAILATVYFSLIQGLSLLVFQGKGMEKKITPEILSSVLRGGQPLSPRDGNEH